MEYWKGEMNWPLESRWIYETCGDGRMGLTWGRVHSECRCDHCHTEYMMRDENGRVTIPISQLKEEYKYPARWAWEKWHLPVDELSEEQWNEGMVAATIRQLVDR